MKLIKRDSLAKNRRMVGETFEELDQLLKSFQVDEYGFFEVTPDKIFKECGVPHKYALVFSSAMNRPAFETAPSIECQLEVAKVYNQTGNYEKLKESYLKKQ